MRDAKGTGGARGREGADADWRAAGTGDVDTGGRERGAARTITRRGFVGLCAAAGLTRGLPSLDGPLEDYPASVLVKDDGAPLKAAEVSPAETIVFAYPYAGVPCFLINIGTRVAKTGTFTSPDDGDYTTPEGVGGGHALVAFIAICTHQLTYPAPHASALRYAATGSELAGGPGRIVCCAHGSVYDPAEGARPVGGPAVNPLLPVRLRHDAATDTLTATGTIGQRFIQRFFSAYKAELIDRFGPGGYRREAGAITTAVPLARYSRVVLAC